MHDHGYALTPVTWQDYVPAPSFAATSQDYSADDLFPGFAEKNVSIINVKQIYTDHNTSRHQNYSFDT